MGPRVHVATTLLGLRGFTVTYGSKVSLSVIPGILNPSSQVPTGLGWESSISGPSVEANVAVGIAPRQARAMAARPALNLLSAARRVTDWARLFVSSSNLLFIRFFRFVVSRWRCSIASEFPKSERTPASQLCLLCFLSKDFLCSSVDWKRHCTSQEDRCRCSNSNSLCSPHRSDIRNPSLSDLPPPCSPARSKP